MLFLVTHFQQKAKVWKVLPNKRWIRQILEDWQRRGRQYEHEYPKVTKDTNKRISAYRPWRLFKETRNPILFLNNNISRFILHKELCGVFPMTKTTQVSVIFFHFFQIPWPLIVVVKKLRHRSQLMRLRESRNKMRKRFLWWMTTPLWERKWPRSMEHCHKTGNRQQGERRPCQNPRGWPEKRRTKERMTQYFKASCLWQNWRLGVWSLTWDIILPKAFFLREEILWKHYHSVSLILSSPPFTLHFTNTSELPEDDMERTSSNKTPCLNCAVLHQ